MRRFTIGYGLLAALALASLSGPARAVVVSGSFSGTVTSSSGSAADLFGVTGPLVGQAITGTLSYETDAVQQMYFTGTSSLGIWYDFGTLPTTIRISETINGVTVQFLAGAYQQLVLDHGGPSVSTQLPSYQFFQVTSRDSGSNPDFIHNGRIAVGAADDSVFILDDPLDPLVGFKLLAAGGLGSGQWDDRTDCGINGVTGPGCRSWNFSVDAIQVPEPATMWMLGAGLAGLGARRRRTSLPG